MSWPPPRSTLSGAGWMPYGVGGYFRRYSFDFVQATETLQNFALTGERLLLETVLRAEALKRPRTDS
jgi:hypothetical protein